MLHPLNRFVTREKNGHFQPRIAPSVLDKIDLWHRGLEHLQFRHPAPVVLRHLPDRRGRPGSPAGFVRGPGRYPVGCDQRSHRRDHHRPGAHALGTPAALFAILRHPVRREFPAVLVGTAHPQPGAAGRGGLPGLHPGRFATDAGVRALYLVTARDCSRLRSTDGTDRLPHVLQPARLAHDRCSCSRDRRRDPVLGRDPATGLYVDRLPIWWGGIAAVPVDLHRRPGTGPFAGGTKTGAGNPFYGGGADGLEQYSLPLCDGALHAELDHI